MITYEFAFSFKVLKGSCNFESLTFPFNNGSVLSTISGFSMMLSYKILNSNNYDWWHFLENAYFWCETE